MGFPYGDGLYGIGLYSRRPDWWHEKSCGNEVWAETVCRPRVWAPDPDLIPEINPLWQRGTQQAVVKEKERIWRTR